MVERRLANACIWDGNGEVPVAQFSYWAVRTTDGWENEEDVRTDVRGFCFWMTIAIGFMVASDRAPLPKYEKRFIGRPLRASWAKGHLKLVIHDAA
jgi:hypothetical protein